MRDFLHVNDVVRGIMLILKSKKAKREIINLGYGKPYKVIEIIKAIRDIIKSGRLDIGKISIRKDESMISYPILKKFINWLDGSQK